jgi:hypothetical protein
MILAEKVDSTTQKFNDQRLVMHLDDSTVRLITSTICDSLCHDKRVMTPMYKLYTSVTGTKR